MFVPYEFDDDSVTLRSRDPGDIARVLRMVNVELPSSIKRPTEVFVTIFREPLTAEESDTSSTHTQGGNPDADTIELPF